MRLVMPASTRPGPHSTTCVTPRAANASIVSTQRTGLDACRASAARIATGDRLLGRRRHCAAPECAGGTIATRASLSARRRAGRLHQRAVERRGHRQQHSALGAARGGGVDRAHDRFAMTRDDDLLGRIEIDGFDDLSLGAAFRADRGDSRRIETEDRGHRADTGRHRLLHRLGAKSHERQRVVKRQRTRGDERRVLAETVSGDDRRHQPARSLPRAPDGDAGRQHDRLRIHRLVELRRQGRWLRAATDPGRARPTPRRRCAHDRMRRRTRPSSRPIANPAPGKRKRSHADHRRQRAHQSGTPSPT